MDRLFEAFERAGKQLYLVGGAVRDRLLGISHEDLVDLDFATDARPDETLDLLKKRRLTTYDVGKRFGTIGTVLRHRHKPGYPKDCQITTFRAAERYEKGSRHPEVAYGQSIEEDLWRRDFSINSIAMQRDGTLIDPYDGQADIAARRLRAVGDPLETLRDDPLRMLRVGRFYSVLGFAPDEPLTQATELRAESILDISRERWLLEVNKLLVGPHAAKALEFLREVRVLGIILPELVALRGFDQSCAVHHKDLWAHTLGVLRQTKPDLVQRWAALLHDIGKVGTRRLDDEGHVHFIGHEAQGAMLFEGIAARFRIDRRTAEAVQFVIRFHDLAESYDSEWTDTAVRRLVRRSGNHLETLLDFAEADLTTADADRRAAALARVAELRTRIALLEEAHALRPKLPRGLGRAIMKAFELPPGPAIGDLVDRIESATLSGALPTSPSLDECVSFLHKPEGGESQS